MNERYLYRAKNIDSGEWATGFYMYSYENKKDYIMTGHLKDYQVDFAHPHLRSRGFEWIEVEPATIGQCTGLKDKNGVLIFEGDILLLSKTNPVKFIVSVEMVKNGYKTVWRYLDDNVVAGSGYFLDNLEIIGNIHDGGFENVENAT